MLVFLVSAPCVFSVSLSLCFSLLHMLCQFWIVCVLMLGDILTHSDWFWTVTLGLIESFLNAEFNSFPLSVIQVRSFQSWRSCCLSRRSRIIRDGWLSRQRMGVLLKSANWCKNTLTRSVLHSLKEFSRKKLDFVFRWERISGRFKLFLALSVQRVIAFPFINAQPSRDGLSCLCVFTGNVSL